MNGRTIVHGHTPITLDEIWDMYDLLPQDQVIDIDNGCFAKFSDGLGQLCGFDLTNRDLYFQENIDLESPDDQCADIQCPVCKLLK